MSDARVLVEQQIWASVTDKAKNEAFNCTNGDVFTWKMIWKDKGEVWDGIVEENGLYKTKMEEITCFDALGQVLKLEIQHVCSMNKSREFGFHGYANTLKSIPEWVQKLREMKILS
ncbi:putative (S)-8-oxocitronellyl enol synthase [Helianthus annuus]|nr:putative (S)-8-oxocitronellyl enol synthase [Helianthus annuus]KAJ0486546.1 putative (S)-8-oxocitronellyl enol synthase [Helianthus annuus]KAJ0657112.1 putative (S)-8-oxocitronellyl enol synthase [Helianthus annuus]KAJ0660691.1 putative (S)-8-oxocitronellyl enol synthase [Helianthus annuus]KAJ0854701.1 putative (S)-8-oxocitronellyl enol synthase [Helianthus annuus]